MASSSRQGTSPSRNSGVDLTLLFGEDEAPRLGELLSLNSVIVVPVDHWLERGNGENHENKCRKLEEEVTSLRAQLSSREGERRNSEAVNKQVKELEKTAGNLRRQLKEQKEKHGRTTSQVEEVKKKLAESEKRNRTLENDVARKRDVIEDLKSKSQPENVTDLTKRCKLAEEKVEQLESQLKQVKDGVEAEKRANKELLKGKEEVERKGNQERLRRGNEIIALKNEKERMTEDQFRFIGFIRQLKLWSGFSHQNENNLIAPDFLTGLFRHVEKMLQTSNAERSELVKNKRLLEQIENLIVQNNRMTASVSALPVSSNNTTESSTARISENSTVNSISDDRSSSVTATPPTSPLGSNDMINVLPVRPNLNPCTTSTTPTLGTSAASKAPLQTNDFTLPTRSETPKAPSPPRTTTLGTTAVTSKAPSKTNLAQNVSRNESPRGPSLSLTTVTRSAAVTTPNPSTPMVTATSIPLRIKPIRLPHSSAATSVTPQKPPLRWSSVVARSIPSSEDTQPGSAQSSSATTTPPKTVKSVPNAPSHVPGLITIVPLSALQEQPSSETSSPGPSQTPSNSPQKRSQESVKQSRNYKQFTEFAISTKPHGESKASSQFRCLCGNVYQGKRGLKAHIRKMTQEWKYKCGTCNQYFFYKSDLARHLETSLCGGNQVESLLDDLMRVPPSTQQQQQPRQSRKRPAPESDGEFMLADLFSEPTQSQQQPSTSTSTSNNNNANTGKSRSGSKLKVNTRKLQYEILKRKKHGPWSKKGAVQGFWYCVCGSRFNSKTNLQTHVQYFTVDWKFKCQHCPLKFLYLGYLKKHMNLTHRIADPFKEFSIGCQLCGMMFHHKPEYYLHRKTEHNLHTSPDQEKSGTSNRIVPFKPLSQLPPPIPSTSTSVPPSAESMQVIDVPSDDEEANINPPQSSLPSGPSVTITTIGTAPGVHLSTTNARRRPIHGNNLHQRHGPIQQDPLSMDNADPSLGKHECECGKVYKSKTALNHHVKTMKYGKIFVCLKCSKPFVQLVNLQGHMKGVHAEPYAGFSCGLCGKTFTSSIVFKKHRMEDH